MDCDIFLALVLCLYLHLVNDIQLQENAEFLHLKPAVT